MLIADGGNELVLVLEVEVEDGGWMWSLWSTLKCLRCYWICLPCLWSGREADIIAVGDVGVEDVLVEGGAVADVNAEVGRGGDIELPEDNVEVDRCTMWKDTMGGR